MPMLSIQFYLVTIIIASAAMLFGLRLLSLIHI